MSAVLVAITLLAATFWYIEFTRRTEADSVYQLILTAPRFARLSPQGRRIAAHVGIATPSALVVVVSVVLAIVF